MMPKNRILKTLLHFDIAVLIYMFTQLILKDNFSVKRILLSFIGLDSFGNESWYIFAILMMYLFTYISFSVFNNKKIFAVGLNLLLIFAYFVVMYKVMDWSFWYDTILCYFVGMVFYFVKPYIEKVLMKKQLIFWGVLTFCFAVVSLGIVYKDNLFFVVIKHIAFSVAVVFVTMKFEINNRILHFFGKHFFSIYILHRLPMIVFSKLGIDNKYIFVILSFAATVLLCIGFDKVMSIIDGRLFKKKTA